MVGFISWARNSCECGALAEKRKGTNNLSVPLTFWKWRQREAEQRVAERERESHCNSVEEMWPSLRNEWAKHLGTKLLFLFLSPSQLEVTWPAFIQTALIHHICTLLNGVRRVVNEGAFKWSIRSHMVSCTRRNIKGRTEFIHGCFKDEAQIDRFTSLPLSTY